MQLFALALSRLRGLIHGQEPTGVLRLRPWLLWLVRTALIAAREARKPMRLLFPGVMLTSVLLAACSSPVRTGPDPVQVLPPPRATGEVASEAPVVAAQEPARRPQVQPQRQLADGSQLPAVRGLIAAADGALSRGEVDLAAVNLERAQRLAPQSALVYQKLANIRLRQKRAAEAEQLARKALAFAGSPAQQATLWQLIASARQMQGQHAAAREARARAAALQGSAVGATP
ncbi:MAG: hypothetical protein K0Q68_2106 [Moraxellaceae bacterium]|jgi:hypothetical protein|nr:hypothetical protein [Moraxellaceae bacterium]